MKWLLSLLLLSGLTLSGCGAGPVDVSRTASPYLHSNVIDEIVYRPEPNYGRQTDSDDMNEPDPLRIILKDDVRTIAFWLNETFHNRDAYTAQDPALFEGDQTLATGGVLNIKSVYGPVEIRIRLKGEYQLQDRYTDNRMFRPAWQTTIDDRYPDEQFYYVETVVIEYKGYFYYTYFLPKLLASPDSNTK